MSNIFLLIFSLMLPFIIGDKANAKELKCEYHLKNLHIEPVKQQNTERTYSVHVSCRVATQHHTGYSNTEPSFRKTFTPVVVSTSDKEKGEIEAYAEGVREAYIAAWKRLLEECRSNALSDCGDCNNVGCTCKACGKNKGSTYLTNHPVYLSFLRNFGK